MFKNLFGKNANKKSTGMVKLDTKAYGIKSELPVFVLGDEDSMYRIAGIDHSPLIVRAHIGAGAEAELMEDAEDVKDAIILSKKALKLPKKQLQVLVDYVSSLILDASEIAYSETNMDLWKGIYHSKEDKVKMTLVAKYGRCAKQAFLKREKSVVNVPRKAARLVRKYEKEGIDPSYFQDLEDDEPIDLTADPTIEPMEPAAANA